MQQKELAALLGLSKSRLSQMVQEGCPTDSPEAVLQWRERRLNIAGRKPTHKVELTFPRLPNAPRTQLAAAAAEYAADLEDEGEDRDSARTRREIAEANVAEMLEAKMRRELIAVWAVKAALGKDYSATRESLLQLADRLGPVVASETDPAACSNIIQEGIIGCLQLMCAAKDKVDDIEEGFE